MTVEKTVIVSRVQLVGRTIVVLACLGVLVPGARADKFVFNPSVEISQGYTNNISFQGEGDSGTSDRVGLLGFDIPIERETRRSRLDFRWRPVFLRYNDFSELDYDDQRLELRWTNELSRKSRFSLFANYVFTQQQGSPEQPDDPDLTLTQRTNREYYRLNLSYDHQLSERWDGDVILSGNGYRYTAIGDLTNAGSFQNRTDYGARIGAARRLSDAVSVGGRYEFRHFDLDASNDGSIPSGQEDSHQLAATYVQEVARRLTLQAALGGYFNSGVEVGNDASGVLAELFLTRTYRSFSARLDLFHRPSSGGSVSGTSIESTIGFTFRSERDVRRKWEWEVSPRYSRREASVGGSTIDSFGLRGNVERRLGYLFGIRLRADGFDQDTNDSVFRADLGFLWYPWGATQLGGRGN
jgi:hypothetical protein